MDGVVVKRSGYKNSKIDEGGMMNILCPVCQGKGWLPNPVKDTTSSSIICRNCGGSGWIETKSIKGLFKGIEFNEGDFSTARGRKINLGEE